MGAPNGVRRVALLTAALSLLVPYARTNPSHQEIYHRRLPHEHGPADDQHTGFSPVDIPKEDLKTTRYKYVKDTHTDDQGNRASAVATDSQALAGHEDRAVRAIQPLQRGSGQHTGIVAPLQARSLDDWEVEDFVLLATVDGSIHARDRRTGAERWELEVDKPMVETIYHHRNKSEDDLWRLDQDWLWIVEPSQDGEIYVYQQGSLGGLHKLHMTVKRLVADMSPFESKDPPVVYNGEKRTRLYTVDAKTGTINKVFGAGAAMSKQPRCPKPGGLDVLDDEECGSSSSFVLGRTEYIVTISNRETADPICTIKYSEWSPNARDMDLYSQYSETMDNRYVYSLHDGSIYSFKHAASGVRHDGFTKKLSSPVVRVFDLARPLQTDEKDPQLIVLPQPTGPVNEAAPELSEMKHRIFVNRTESGGWFALSEDTYPFVTGSAKDALCYNDAWLQETMWPHCTDAEKHKGLVGVHALSESQAPDRIPLTISGHAYQPRNVDEIPSSVDDAGSVPSLPSWRRSKILVGAVENVYDTILVLALLLISYLFINRHAVLKTFNKGTRFKNPLALQEQTQVSVPSSPTVNQPPWTDEPESLEVAKHDPTHEVEKPQLQNKSRSSTLLEPAKYDARSRSNSLNANQQPDDNRTVRFDDHSPIRGDDENFDPSQSSQPEKKKARRGNRGGTKHRKKGRANSQNGSKDEVAQTVKDIMQKPEEPTMQPDHLRLVVSTVTAMEDPDGTLRIGQLTVKTDTVLGYGGHGTMVYQGSFGSRAVAVKRMLREFYDIASHEVGLLQESDDHPNVVRYFAKEEDNQFFYIALELCSASLQDVIERPQDHADTILSCPDQPEMLRQITSGLHYLHTLKIVHRDIKPQNILISKAKANPLQPSAIQRRQLLISDFGLCKKLEADQNSFRATTAHAAGTSGWRAPELLMDDDPDSRPSLSQTTDTSEPLVIDTQTKRSATRAIDIFSLGCIFYYCLTNGQHPYDNQDKFMREANIVKGNYNIDALGCLGDYQWEARQLVEAMLNQNPKARPDAASILRHPFFWSAEDRLNFLCDTSDAFEHEKYKVDMNMKDNPGKHFPPSVYVEELEKRASEVIGENRDFLRLLPHEFVNTLGKQRKYKGDSLLDLLRALRNKKNHYEDMPEEIKRKIGGLSEGYLTYWTRKFPFLLLTCWAIVDELGWSWKERFKRYYEGMES